MIRRRLYYNCSSYKESGGARCSNYYISEDAVYEAITQEIEKMLADGFLSGHSTKIMGDYEKQLANIDADIDTENLQRIRRTLTVEERVALLEEAKRTTAWIYEAIKKVCKQTE